MNFWLISIYANDFLIAGVMTLAWEIFQSAMFFCCCMLCRMPLFFVFISKKQKRSILLFPDAHLTGILLELYVTFRKSGTLFFFLNRPRLSEAPTKDSFFSCSAPQWSSATRVLFLIKKKKKVQRMPKEALTSRWVGWSAAATQWRPSKPVAPLTQCMQAKWKCKMAARE